MIKVYDYNPQEDVVSIYYTNKDTNEKRQISIDALEAIMEKFEKGDSSVRRIETKNPTDYTILKTLYSLGGKKWIEEEIEKLLETKWET